VGQHMPPRQSERPAASSHLSSILATLEATAQVFGEREIVVAREMTKQFEEILRRPAARRTHFEAAPVRGEFTLIIPSSRFH
jgi:16S rRNA C1402 (ribose-2'-O) methylase RsmI